MLDTVTIFRPFRLHSATPLPGWRATAYSEPLSDRQGRESSFSLDDSGTGYHGHGQNGEVRYHRASLPRLLHGDNGKLIKNQVELDTALDRLRQKAGELGNSCTPDLHFTRV